MIDLTRPLSARWRVLGPLAGLLALAGCAGEGAGAGQRQVSDEQVLVERAAHTVSVMRSTAGSKLVDLLPKAKAVVVFPDMIKGGIGLGASHGDGVLVARTANGWSDPAFYTSTSISLGIQIGMEESAVVMLVMTDKALQTLLQPSSFTLKAQGGLALADLNTASQAELSGADVIVWSKSEGAFGGLALAGSDISQNTDDDRAYYGQKVMAADIIAGKVSNPGAAVLKKALA